MQRMPICWAGDLDLVGTAPLFCRGAFCADHISVNETESEMYASSDKQPDMWQIRLAISTLLV